MPKINFNINATLVVMNNLRNQETLTNFGDRLKTLRTKKGFTLEQLAFEADIELSQVHRAEKGKINPTLTTLIALAKGLGVSLADLVGE
jgi:transcriptional regulator with XRE-family HTH domain